MLRFEKGDKVKAKNRSDVGEVIHATPSSVSVKFNYGGIIFFEEEFLDHLSHWSPFTKGDRVRYGAAEGTVITVYRNVALIDFGPDGIFSNPVNELTLVPEVTLSFTGTKEELIELMDDMIEDGLQKMSAQAGLRQDQRIPFQEIYAHYLRGRLNGS